MIFVQKSLRSLRALTIGTAFTLASCTGPEIPPPPSAPVAATKITPATALAPVKPVRLSVPAEVSVISLSDFFTLEQSGKALIYDARAAFFYHLGHIPGAINLSKNHCDASITARAPEITAAIAAGKTVVVYCSNTRCPDARAVAAHLANAGYPTKIFPGGWEEWRTADLTGQ